MDGSWRSRFRSNPVETTEGREPGARLDDTAARRFHLLRGHGDFRVLFSGERDRLFDRVGRRSMAASDPRQQQNNDPDTAAHESYLRGTTAFFNQNPRCHSLALGRWSARPS